MSRLCIFLFISTPKDGGETDGKIPLPDLRGQEEDRGVAPDRRPAGRHRGPPLRPVSYTHLRAHETRLSVHYTTIYKELQRGATGELDRNQREGYSAELAERRLRESFKRRGKKAVATLAQ